MTTTLEDLVMQADEAGYRLEMVNGIGIWEAHPAARHQSESFRIQSSIGPAHGAGSGCSCVHLADVYVRFPDGSFKRPDLAIFCRQPEEEETAISLVPEAVIEIISRGHEKKDIEVGVPFYLSQGVRDVVVFDPYSQEVTHYRLGDRRTHRSPVELDLECGCSCTI